MKKIFTVVLWIIFAMLLIFATCKGGAEGKKSSSKGKMDTRTGHYIKGDNVVFVFDTKIYSGQLLDELESVTVAGEFNGWDTGAADWQATDPDGDGLWTLEKPKSKVPNGVKFKFVANQVDWMQPPTEIDKKYLADDGFGGFNLVVNYE
jgi:hypothetical protein